MITWPRERMTSPGYDDVFMRFSADVGGTFLQERYLFGFRKPPQVSVYVKPWIIMFDTHEVAGLGDSGTTYTRVRATYVSKDPFEFRIYRPGFFSKLAAGQDSETGYPEFDSEFSIQPYGESKAQAVIENAKIRQLIQSLLFNGNCPVLKAETKDWWRGYQTLCYEEGDIITEVGRLKSILELFSEVLNHLCRVGSATEDDPNCML